HANTHGTLSAATNSTPNLPPLSLDIAVPIFTITPDAGQSKIYVSADPTLTYTNSEGLLAASFTGALSRALGESVGNYAISLGTLSAGNNYSLSRDAASFEVTANAVTITPDAG